MSTSWKSQTGGGHYAIQFETDDPKLYKRVEKACQRAIDSSNKSKQTPPPSPVKYPYLAIQFKFKTKAR